MHGGDILKVVAGYEGDNELISLPKKITQNNILINKILPYSAKKLMQILLFYIEH